MAKIATSSRSTSLTLLNRMSSYRHFQFQSLYFSTAKALYRGQQGCSSKCVPTNHRHVVYSKVVAILYLKNIHGEVDLETRVSCIKIDLVEVNDRVLSDTNHTISILD
mmetsp:Transcript_14622/g.31495  ORF Transcript_14622/g.31495 Transcript_14622/m.31495 type:complete len:108 (+) Transcript_14622:247-570(+)